MAVGPDCGITRGGSIRTREWGTIRATESVHAANLKLGRHRHASTCFTYVLDGGFVENVEGQELDCRPGTVMIKQANSLHANTFGRSGARSLLVEVPEALLQRFEPTRRLFETSPGMVIPGAATSASRIHSELRVCDSVSALIVEGLVLDLLGRAGRSLERTIHEALPPQWLKRVKELLHEQYADPPTMEELAEQAGVHVDHLYRIFRRYYKSTPGSYVRRVRVEHALRLIRETDRPLSEVAYETGYADQSHMTRQVRAATGMPPGRVRRSDSRDDLQ